MKRKHASLVGFGLLGIFFLGSCEQQEDILSPSSGRLVLNGNYEPSRSRNYWEEDAGASGRLRFHWENSVEGSENLVLAVTDESKIYDFLGSSTTNASLARVTTTSNPLVSRISPLLELADKNPLKPGDEIYSYVPASRKEDVTASPTRLLVTMDIPREIPVTKLNSTRHLSPYIYMAGKGTVSSEADILTSNIHYRMLPAILRFKIKNLNADQSFNPEVIRIWGDICTLATITVIPASQVKPDQIAVEAGSKAVENIIYSYGDEVTIRMSDVTIPASGSANTYALAFPTNFAEKRLFFELEGTYGEEKIERVAYLSGSVIPESQFKSNFCYTFNLEMDKKEFKISGVGCGDWTGSEEDLPSHPANGHF